MFMASHSTPPHILAGSSTSQILFCAVDSTPHFRPCARPTLTMESSPADAIHWPSGLNLRLLTASLWPL